MIRYTLLPEPEIKSLRREYHARLFVIFLFFLSCAIIAGIISLAPSFFLSQNQENQALIQTQELQKSRQAGGFDKIEKDLAQSQLLVQKIKTNSGGSLYYDVIQSILTHRTAGITLTSFDFAGSSSSATSTDVIIQGKALTRDDLIAFKKDLEQDKHFKQVELPISDLAKSKDISFAFRMAYR
jgi:hypothetical protein